jgi:hypothetical protein
VYIYIDEVVYLYWWSVRSSQWTATLSWWGGLHTPLWPKELCSKLRIASQINKLNSHKKLRRVRHL